MVILIFFASLFIFIPFSFGSMFFDVKNKLFSELVFVNLNIDLYVLSVSDCENNVI